MKLGKNTNLFCQHDSEAYKPCVAVVGRADYNKCKFIMEMGLTGIHCLCLVVHKCIHMYNIPQ